MERNVMGELNVCRGSGAKPNFSEIARRHGMDRHTVAKYWRDGESAADGRSARGSAFDPLEEVIRAKAQLPGMTKMAVYAFLREGRGEGLPGYGAFTAWCRARDVPFGGVGGREPHPRFETPPGRQLQFDWKEGMRLVDSEGEVFEFSVFTATLGYSRKHRFIPVRSRTLDDLLSCLRLAAKRGVDVRIYTPGVPDKPTIYQLTRSYFPHLLQAGVKIYSYTPGFLHAKTWLVDDRIAAVGTVNLDYRSLYLHFENSVLLYGGAVLDDVRRDLAEIEKESAAVTLADCRTGFFGTLYSAVLRLVAPLC